MIKVSVVLFFIGIATMFAFGHWHHMMANWHPFIPQEPGSLRRRIGWSGIMRGGSVVFFAYIGFDAVSTAAQEARNPQKDMPFGILGSLIICTVLYIIVAGLLTGVKPYATLNTPSPVADGAAAIGATLGRLSHRPRRHRRSGFRHAGHDPGPDARALHHVSRRPAAQVGRHHPSPFPHALAGHHRGRRPGRLPRRVLQHHVSGPARQPRHAARLHHRLPGRVGDAEAAARCPAAVPDPVGSDGAHPAA